MNNLISIQLPSSKSISHRVLLIQKLCKETITITHLSTAEDTRLMERILQQDLTEVNDIDVQDAGTPYRFLLAYMATVTGQEFILRGTHRMHDRPIKDLVDALRSLGAQIEYLEKEGYPPVHIVGRMLSGGEVNVHADVSSQFISALCLLAPILPMGLTLHIQTPMVSEPYIHLTLALMKEFGVVSTVNNKSIVIPHQAYQAKTIAIEADWSSACFFYAALMIQPSLNLHLQALNPNSAQGDAYMIQLGEQFGIHTTSSSEGLTLHTTAQRNIPSVLDLSHYPDLAIPIMVAVAINYPQVSIIGVDHLVYKESNRIQALSTELSKINIVLNYQDGQVTFTNQYVPIKQVQFQSYNDHRIVMALNLIRLLGVTVSFDDSECVKKSFPDYFTQFEKMISTTTS